MTKTRLLTISLFVTLLLPTVTLGASSFPYWGTDGIVSCTGDGSGGKPACTSICQMLETGQNVIFFFMSLAVLVVAPVLIVWGGLMILIAGGSPQRMSDGKKIITGTVIGVVLALGAFLIVNIVMKALADAGGGNKAAKWYEIECSGFPTFPVPKPPQ